MNPKLTKKIAGTAVLGLLVAGGIGLTASSTFAQSLPSNFFPSSFFAAQPLMPNVGYGANVGYGNALSVHVSNNNNATVNQSTSVNVSTGGNTSNNNIGSVSVHSGSVSVQSSQSSQVNTNVTRINLPSQSSSSATVITTGQ